MSLSRRLAAAGLGTAFLLAVVVGSGIMSERLAAGNKVDRLSLQCQVRELESASAPVD